MQRFLLSISILLLSLSSMVVRAQEFVASDQQPLRDSIGCKMKYATTIEMSKGYLSGISVVVRETDVYRGVIFNEFGITALEDEKYHIKYVFSLMHDSDKPKVTEENANATEE